jgi:23S rRNA (uracil1939-C5)-methyltransferase
MRVPATDQRRRKVILVREALEEWPELTEVPVERCLESAWPRTYRNRAKLAVRGGGRVRLGLYVRGSDELVATERCPVHRPAVSSALRPLAEWLGQHRLAAPRGPIRYVDVREAVGPRGAVHVTLVSAKEIEPERLPNADLRRRMPGRLVGLAMNINPDNSSYVFGDKTVRVWGSKRFVATLPGSWSGADLRLEVPATGFFQVNACQIPPVAAAIAEHLDGAGEGAWFDLYCGVGTWGIAASRARGTLPRRLLGVEDNAASVACAADNARAAGLGRIARYRAGKTEEAVTAMVAEESPVAVILNPGRPGCRPEALDVLIEAAPRRIAYLSCNPETLARDLARLAGGGFTVERVLPIDMMPHTDQVEALALLQLS